MKYEDMVNSGIQDQLLRNVHIAVPPLTEIKLVPGSINGKVATPTTVLGTQVGGDHYTKQKIQPIEYIWANGLGFSEGNVVKYVTRWKDKGGIKDLRKAHHHLALLIEEAERAEREDGVKYGL